MKSLTISKCIKKGSCGEVYKLKWLGLVCATKKIDVELDKMFIKEVSILRSLSHPNLIIYYFAMKGSANESIESIVTKDKKEYLYIEMELMQNNLSNMLEVEKETMVMNKITQHAIVKVIDFGMSKIEVGRNPKAIEKNYIYGSLNYMAPKAMRNKFQIMAICHFKADVYSFAMICSKILSKKDPFHDICDMKEILERIEKGERPNLPSNCDDLIELIQECWRLNPLHRPKFANICERLKLLKKKYLVGIGIANAPKFEAAKNNYHQNIEFQQIHIGLPFVDIFEEEIFGRAQYLLQIKEQCAIKVKALYLVGIGGIDKTTIAKAILTSLKDIYNASCFVECIESGGDCYTTSCNILEQFKVKSKPKDVKEAQKMLKSFLEENKTILVFDNVKN
uniref:Protein kinase domain-containing protein n=1 Tax=Physcomitrium patens TaxID=3218 RepID=A0A2K1JGN3_PHYPA|nr:hypothetical protein PHYPA_018125 [Physcomitrium patens]